MPTINLLEKNSVRIKNGESQWLFTRRPTDEIDVLIGASTVGANTTSKSVSAVPKLNVSQDWIRTTLNESGCSEKEIARVFEHLKLTQ